MAIHKRVNGIYMKHKKANYIVIPTSTHSNNCGMHIIVPHLLPFLRNLETDNSSTPALGKVVANISEKKVFIGTKGYRYFKEAFAEYYRLPPAKNLAADIEKLLEKYSHPQDMEMLLGPVLRVMLRKVLENSQAHKDSLKVSFETLVNQCQQRYRQQHPRRMNKQHLRNWLDAMAWSDTSEHEELFVPNKDIIAEAIFQHGNSDISRYWDRAYQNYCNYQADPTKGVYISESQIALLCASFKFDFKYILPNGRLSESGLSLVRPLATVIAKNASGIHWELVTTKKSSWQKVKENTKFQYQGDRLSCLARANPTGQDSNSRESLQNPFRNAIRLLINDNAYQAERLLKAKIIKKFRKALNENNIDLLMMLAKGSLKSEFETIKNDDGNHILHVIAMLGSKEILAETLSLQPRVARLVNIPNCQGDTPLHMAIKSKNLDLIKPLIANGALIAKRNLQGNTSLHMAVALTDSNLLETLCIAGYAQNRATTQSKEAFDVLAKNKKRMTAKCMTKACAIWDMLSKKEAEQPFQNAIRLIYQGRYLALKNGINKSPAILNHVDENGDTLLHHALMAYKQTGKSCILIILNAKPNVNIKNKKGLTPLLLAATLDVLSVEHKNEKCLIIKYFNELGAKMTEVDETGFTALHYAAKHGKDDEIEELIRLGAFIDHVTPNGLAPIHLAAYYGKKRAFKALLRLGSDFNMAAYPNVLTQLFENPIRTTQAITPCWLALNSKADDIVDIIFDQNIQINNIEVLCEMRSIDGSTLVHFFAFTKDYLRFKQAVRVGIDPFIANDRNYLPFHVACKAGSLEIVRRYLEVLAPQQSYWSKMKGYSFDINNLPEKGVNALTLAGENNDIIQYLTRHGAIRVPATAERRESVINRLYNFYNSQKEFRSQLESTTTNQVLNAGRIMASTLLSFASPVGMGVAAAHQLLLYGMPIIRSKSTELYYTVKPKVHNNAPSFVEKGLDVTASATSTVAQGIFSGLDWVDCFANPARRIAGYSVSMGMANLASQFTDNLQLQGAAYFFGREVGMYAVEAYQKYGKAPSDAAVDAELSKAFNLWTSLLGKEKGEWCVTCMQQISQMHQAILENVGWFEHSVVSYIGTNLETIRGAVAAVGLQALEESIVSALTMVSVYPQSFYSALQHVSREVYKQREHVLTMIEQQIVENLLPDSEHRDVALQYLMLHKTVLLTQILSEKQSEQVKQDHKLKALEEEYNVLDNSAVKEKAQLQLEIETATRGLIELDQECEALAEQITVSQKAHDAIWEKTPKGACELKHREARQNYVDGQVKIEDLKLKLTFLEEHDFSQAVIQETQIQLQEAQSALNDLDSELSTAENQWLSLANPVETKLFSQQKEEIKIRVSEQINAYCNEQKNVYQQLDNLLVSQNALADLWVDLRSAQQQFENAKTDVDIIDLRINAIVSPPPIHSRTIVENALDQYPNDCEQVVKLILNEIVATGMISFADAAQRMQSSLIAAFASHKHKDDHLNKVLSQQINQLKHDYLGDLVQQRNTLQIEVENALSKLKQISEQYDSQMLTVKQAKIAYEAEFAAGAADPYLNEQLVYQPHNWDVQHNSENIKSTLILMGQPNMTLGKMIDHGGPTSQWHQAANLAKMFVDYKYLFLVAPNIDMRLQEIDALAAELAKQALGPDQIAILKQNWDLEIAEQLLSNSKSLAPDLRAASISHDLQNGFCYHESQGVNFENDDTSLTQILASQFEGQDETGATQAIANVLQNQTHTISILEAGAYEAPKNTPHVPSKSHGMNRWWDNAKKEIKHYGKKILKNTGGVSMAVDSSGISAGFTYGNQFRVVQFNAPKPPPVFTLPERPTSATHKQTASSKALGSPSESVINDIPHVVVMPWESANSVFAQPLIFSSQAQTAAQTGGVITRSQAKLQEQREMLLPTGVSQTTNQSQSCNTQLTFDNPFLQGIWNEQLAQILHLVENVDKSYEKVNSPTHRYNTRLKERERQQRVEDEFFKKPAESHITAEMGGLGAIPLQGSASTSTSAVTISRNQEVVEQLLKIFGIGLAEAMSAATPMGAVPVESPVINHNPKIATISAELRERIEQLCTAFQISVGHQIGHGIMGGDLTRKQQEIAKHQQPYSGANPDDIPSDLDYTSLPVVSSQGSKTESLVNQPGVAISSYSTPAIITRVFDLLYRRDEISSKIGVYDHEYQKHKPRARGIGAAWEGASVNPIPDAGVGQKLLDSSYASPDKPDVRFNYYNEKIIIFRSSNDGKWHAYEVNKSISFKVGNNILAQFKKDRLIDEKRYRQLIKK